MPVEQIKVQNEEQQIKVEKKAMVSPRSRVPRHATKKFELGKKIDILLDDNPLAPIVLSATEIKLLKQVVFRGYTDQLDPVYRKVANKEVDAIHKAVLKNIDLGMTEMGPPKRCEDVVRENLKDFRGIIKAVGYDSPNKKFKTILGVNSGTKGIEIATANPSTQVNLSMMQLQHKEIKSIFAIEKKRDAGAHGLPPTSKPARVQKSINADLDNDLNAVAE